MHILTYVLFGLSLLVLTGTLYFISTIKVLDEWTISIPSGDIHVGDTVVIQSVYNKVRETGGESVRYIQCENRSGLWIRYELNRATANRQKGKGGTGIVLTVRRDIADVPTTCKFTINIRYDVLPFRSVYVTNNTREFTLLPERQDDSQDGRPVTIQQNQPLLPIELDSQTSVSSSDNTLGTQLTQSESSQPEVSINPDVPANPEQELSLLDRLLNPIRRIL